MGMRKNGFIFVCGGLCAVFVVKVILFSPQVKTADLRRIEGNTNAYEVKHAVLVDSEYMAKCVYAESWTESELCQRLVIDCILNQADDKSASPTEIINASGNFEVVSNGKILEAPVCEEILTLIEEEIDNRSDSTVLYFRTDFYHDFGTPKIQVENMFFSSK